MTERICKGQVWKRKSDGVLTTVISVAPQWTTRPDVMHQSQRRTHTEVANFLKKYELVRDVKEEA